MRAVLNPVLSGLARLLTDVFFRSIEVSGAARIPRGVPLLIVANHVNSVVDPMLLMGFVDDRMRMLAKSTLWSHPVMGPLLIVAGALPVYRHRDAGADATKNLETFARCREELSRGGIIALFPEGTSHNHPHPLPLKTGAARIALETLAQDPSTGLRVLPVGLVYEAKDRFRSRVLINVGEPIDPQDEASAYAMDRRGAVRTLTARIALSLDALTASYATWDEARLLNLAAAVIGHSTLREHFARSRVFLAAYREHVERDPSRVSTLVRSVETYENHLRDLSIEDDDVTAFPQRGRAWFELMANLPWGLAGFTLNGLPFVLTAWVRRRFSRTPDEAATNTLITGLFTFPLGWLAVGAAVGLLAGPLFGLLTVSLAPLTARAALRVRAAALLLQRPRPTTALLQQRAALAVEIREFEAESASSHASAALAK